MVERLLRHRLLCGSFVGSARAQAHLAAGADGPRIEVGLLVDEGAELLVAEVAGVEVRVGAAEVLADDAERGPAVVAGGRVDRLGQRALQVDRRGGLGLGGGESSAGELSTGEASPAPESFPSADASTSRKMNWSTARRRDSA